MASKYLEILANMDVVAEELRNNPTPDSYWIEEAKMLEKLQDRHQRENDSIKMSHEKFITPFTI